MAASTEVGNVTSMKLKTEDVNENITETTITSTKAFVSPIATYSQVDTFARALAGLSTNTYKDTILVTEVSVEEELAE